MRRHEWDAPAEQLGAGMKGTKQATYMVLIDKWLAAPSIQYMTREEELALFRLCLFAAKSSDGGLPVSDYELAQLSRLGADWWEKPKGSDVTSGERVRAQFFEQDGRLRHKEVDADRARLNDVKQQRLEANEKRWGRKSDTGGIRERCETDAAASLPQCETDAKRMRPHHSRNARTPIPQCETDAGGIPSSSSSSSSVTEESRLRENNNNIGVFVVEPEPLPKCADDCPATYVLLTSPEAWKLSPIPASRVIAAAMGELILPDEQLASVVREIWLAGGRSAKTPQAYITRALPEQLVQMRQQYQALLADKRTGQQDRQMILARLPERFKARGVPGGTRKGKSSSLEQAGAVQGGIQPGVSR
jgi:uncharacterized protein YdaU (DUF1376 family)